MAVLSDKGCQICGLEPSDSDARLGLVDDDGKLLCCESAVESGLQEMYNTLTYKPYCYHYKQELPLEP